MNVNIKHTYGETLPLLQSEASECALRQYAFYNVLQNGVLVSI